MTQVPSACPLCGSVGIARETRTLDFNWRLPGEFRYVTCGRCGLVRQEPQPSIERIAASYPAIYGSSMPEDPSGLLVEGSCGIHRYRADRIARYHPHPGRLLDVGCGSGAFLAFMHRRGWEVEGIESSGPHARYARERMSLPRIHTGWWPEAAERLPESRFTLITLWHVLEHVLDPVASLAAAYRALAPGGLLAMETPNASSWTLRLFGRYSTVWDAPRHLFLFTQATLTCLVEKTGLHLRDAFTYSPTTMEFSESLRYMVENLGWRQYRPASSLGPPAPPIGGGAPINRRRRLTVKEAFHASERALIRLASTLLDPFGAGNHCFVIAEKARK